MKENPILLAKKTIKRPFLDFVFPRSLRKNLSSGYLFFKILKAKYRGLKTRQMNPIRTKINKRALFFIKAILCPNRDIPKIVKSRK